MEKEFFWGSRKNGSSFHLPKLQRIHRNDFVYCKIMAWEGAFGIAPEEVDGSVMSGAFVAYEIDRDKLEPKFIDYYFKIRSVWEKMAQAHWHKCQETVSTSKCV